MDESTIDDLLASSQDMKMSALYDKAVNSLYEFDKYILGNGLMEEHTHGGLCAFVESLMCDPMPRVEYLEKHSVDFTGSGALSRDIKIFDRHYDINEMNKKFRLILMPRGSFKTTVVTIGFTLQTLLRDPNIRILVDSEVFDKSRAFISEMKGHLEGNKLYRQLFFYKYGCYPDDKKNSDKWTDSELNLAARHVSRKEPNISAAGIGTTKVGMHYDMIICDDLHSEKNVTTKDAINQVIEHYKGLLSLLEPNGIMIVIGTRWDYNDVYQYIIDHEIKRFSVYARQALLPGGQLLFPERLTKEFLENQKISQGSYFFSCNPGEAPILMSDFSLKPIKDVKVGDEVIGFEFGKPDRKHRLVKTVVTETNSRVADVNKVHLDSGKTIRCTEDHRWFTGRHDETHQPYLKAKVGRPLLEVVDVSEDTDIERLKAYQYLAGMIDGEGACKYGSTSIHQSKEKNPEVYQRIKETLDFLDIKYHQYDNYFVLNGGKKTKFDILRYGNPAKKHQIVKTIMDNSGWMVQRRDNVIEIEPDGREDVYALTTETGNYVVWGYASKNCQYQNLPIDDDTAVFKYSDMKRVSKDFIDGRPINWFLTVDPAISQDKYADYTAMVVAGYDNERNIYVKDVMRARMTPAEIVDNIFYLYEVHKPSAIGIENVAFQKTLQYSLHDKMKERGWWLPVREIKRGASSKEDRIKRLQPFYEYGHIYHLDSCANIDDLEYELVHFPKGQTDDMIDALSDIVEIGYPPTGRKTERSEDDTRKRKNLLKMLSKPRSSVTRY